MRAVLLDTSNRIGLSTATNRSEIDIYSRRYSKLKISASTSGARHERFTASINHLPCFRREGERKYSSTENMMWAIVFLLLQESSDNEINAHGYEIAVEGVGKLRRGGFCPAHLRAVPEIRV